MPDGPGLSPSACGRTRNPLCESWQTVAVWQSRRFHSQWQCGAVLGLSALVLPTCYRRNRRLTWLIVGFGLETTGALGAQAKAFLHRVAAASGDSPRLVAQRYRNMTAAIAVALKKAFLEKRYLALCVNAPDG